MTGRAFAGLDQSFDEDGEPTLEACRPSGERAPIAHLSEGARDQLYLALRLAYIENYASRAEAPPFIGDDIFASFDDSRTGAGLEALASISDRIQPILFTHHLHVIEQARLRGSEERLADILHSDRVSKGGGLVALLTPGVLSFSCLREKSPPPGGTQWQRHRAPKDARLSTGYGAG